jgi:hypothetical protein
MYRYKARGIMGMASIGGLWKYMEANSSFLIDYEG